MAMVQAGVVTNISVWDGITKWSPAGYTLVDVTAIPTVVIGSTYDGSKFTAPIQNVVSDPMDDLKTDIKQLAAAAGINLTKPLA